MKISVRKLRFSEKWLLFIIAHTIVFFMGLVIVMNLAVLTVGHDNIVSRFSSDKKYDCILVLGAGLRSDGSPSDMLSDRLRAAVELYEIGVSDTVMLSGDRSGEEYDEVYAMKAFCLREGIPEEALVLDNEGFSTYESVMHAVSDRKYQSIVIVTQKYHLHRALYIAKGLDADAVGFSANYNTYRGQIFRDVREVAARIKDLIKVTFL